MIITYDSEPSEEARRALEALQGAVAKALEKKRRLGQYAVFWEDGKIIFDGDDAPTMPEDHS